MTSVTPRLLDAIIDAEPECVKVMNPDGTLRLVNPAGLRILEAESLEQISTLPVRQLVVEEDRPSFDDLTERVFQGQSGVLEFRMQGLHGTKRWIETHAVPLVEEGQRVTALLAISRDVTDRRTALQALREQEAKYRDLFEQATEGIFVCDERLRFIDVNPAACEMMQYARDELLAMSVPDLVEPGDMARLGPEVARLSSGTPVTSEWRTRRRDGRSIVVEICAKRLATGRIQVFARDVTERAELHMRLLQAQKMESIGRLAGGIAHDFNNLLTVISGTVELALMTTPAESPLRADLEQIQLAAGRGSTLIGQLLAMSRQQILQPEILDVNAVLRRMDGMLRRLIGEDILLTLRLAVDPLTVRTDAHQLEQIILNLVLNARDAMPDGGDITISTRAIEAGAPGFNERQVLLEIADTGTGMDEATRKQIFEPFFTTKEPGKGTGLGLSMVYGTVAQSGGTVVASSEPGGGTVMRVYLPCAGAPAPCSDAIASRTPVPGGHETILLVEDEPAIRGLARAFLTAAGYSVLDAAGGSDALDCLSRHDGVIDLLITDVVMPGMNGRELASRVTKMRPGVKVLYTSGYTDDAILRRGVLAESHRFIAKPYSSEQLRRKVRDVLDT